MPHKPHGQDLRKGRFSEANRIMCYALRKKSKRLPVMWLPIHYGRVWWGGLGSIRCGMRFGCRLQ